MPFSVYFLKKTYISRRQTKLRDRKGKSKFEKDNTSYVACWYVYFPIGILERNELVDCSTNGGMARQLRSGNLNQYFDEMMNWLARCARPR